MSKWSSETDIASVDLQNTIIKDMKGDFDKTLQTEFDRYHDRAIFEFSLVVINDV